VRSKLLRDPAVIKKIVRQFDDLRPWPPTAFSCPTGFDSQIAVLLAYPSEKRVAIDIEQMPACEGATNGDVARIANGYRNNGPRLIAELEQLTH
jgi:hypothetical protein